MVISKKDSRKKVSKVKQKVSEVGEENKPTHLDIIKADKTIKNWLNTINARPVTRKNFSSSMAMYTDFLKMTPDELLEEAEAEAGLPARKRNLKSHIVDFREQLQNSGVSEHTVRSRITAVRSFYLSNEILLPKIKFEKPITIEANDQIPTKEDLQDCLAICDPLEKAIMLAGISSGLASNELRSLKLQKFYDGYDEETGITKLENLYRQKTRVKGYTTFFSPEASKAILEYIEYRNRPTKGVGILRQQQREKQRTTKGSYLFILKNVPDTYLETRDEELRKMGENALLNLYKNISEKAQKNTDKGYNFIRSHTMRKFFNSTLANQGCDPFSREFWMGHQLSETQAAYFRANIQSQKELYKKYIPYLTIAKELDVSTNPEYLNAIERAEKAETEVIRVSVERDEIQKLKAQLEEMTANFELMGQFYNEEVAAKKTRKVEFLPDDGKEPSSIEDLDEYFIQRSDGKLERYVRVQESL